MCKYPVQPSLHLLLAVCTFLLHIPVYIIIYEVHSILNCTFYFIAHFTPYFFSYFYSYLYLYIFSCVMFNFCFYFFAPFNFFAPLSGPVLIYISLLIISCIIEYVRNKRTLNLVISFLQVLFIYLFFICAPYFCPLLKD